MNALSAPRRLVPGPVMQASVVYPVLRVASVVMIVFVAVVSLVDDPAAVTSGGGALGDWVSTIIFGSPAYSDKVAHFLAYAATSLLTLVAFGRHRWSAVLVLLGLLALGGTIELLQAAGGVRSGDWLDLLANSLGILIGGGAGATLRLTVRRLDLSPI